MCERPYRVKPGCPWTKPSSVGLPIPKGHVEPASYPQRPSQGVRHPDVDNEGDEDETGDVQVIGWRDPFATHRRVLGSQVVEVTRRVSRWDETTNVIAKATVPNGRVSSCLHTHASH